MHRSSRVTSDETTSSWASVLLIDEELHERRHDMNNYRTRRHRMKGELYRNRDGQRSFFWGVGCSLCIMTEPRAASAGSLLYLHAWMGSRKAIWDGGLPAIVEDAGPIF